ncbi:MAG: ABC transporter permease, partial [Chloroflexi bacterium]|nr:ABC transporter permease [Chloroflexota bacterium]
QPIPRWSLLLSKFAAFVIGVGVIMLGSVVGLLIGIALTREDVSFDIGGLLLMHLHGGMLVIALGALGILFSVLFLDGGKAWGATGVVLFGTYLLHVVSGLADWAERFRYFSFFYYWRPRDVFGTGSLEGSSLLVFAGVSLFALLAALWVFERRELVR